MDWVEFAGCQHTLFRGFTILARIEWTNEGWKYTIPSSGRMGTLGFVTQEQAKTAVQQRLV
jgi:hypothetical protein